MGDLMTRYDIVTHWMDDLGFGQRRSYRAYIRFAKTAKPAVKHPVDPLFRKSDVLAFEMHGLYVEPHKRKGA